MKKAVIAILATACAIPAMAGDNYVGGTVGRGDQKVIVDGVGSLTESSTGFALFGGHQFNKNFGAEVGVVQFGKATISSGGDKLSFEPSSLYAAVTGAVPLTAELSVYAKLGVARSHTKGSVLVGGVTDSGTTDHTGAMMGVGVSYALNPKTAIVIEYTDFGKVADEDGVSLKANQVSAGVRFKF